MLRTRGILGVVIEHGLRHAGLHVPRDVGWAHLDWLPEDKGQAGVYGNSEYTGAVAVELVVSQLHRGEAGAPARAFNYQAAGSRVEGHNRPARGGAGEFG